MKKEHVDWSDVEGMLEKKKKMLKKMGDKWVK